MDEPGGHYAKWSKPVTGGLALPDSTYMRCPNSQTHRSRKQVGGCQGLGGGGKRESLLSGYKISVMQDE